MALDERRHIVTSIRWRIAAPNESEGERPQPRRRGRVGERYVLEASLSPLPESCARTRSNRLPPLAMIIVARNERDGVAP